MNDTTGPYVPAQVWLDDAIRPMLAEVHGDRRWNGWAIPRFTREQAESIAEFCNTDDSDLAMWWDGDVLVCRDEQGVEVDRWAPDSLGGYAVGASSWVWDSAHHLALIDSLSILGECSCGAGWMGTREQVLGFWRSHLAGQ
jgi:hypothetical protein